MTQEEKDEKIRKDLTTFLIEVFVRGKNTNFDRWNKSDCSNWIAWVEEKGKRKPVDEETSSTLEEHYEMVRKIDEAFRRSLEDFFSNRYELISKRKKPGWRMSPPK